MQIGQKDKHVFIVRMQTRNVMLSWIALSWMKCRTEFVVLNISATQHCTELCCTELKMFSCSKLHAKEKTMIRWRLCVVVLPRRLILGCLSLKGSQFVPVLLSMPISCTMLLQGDLPVIAHLATEMRTQMNRVEPSLSCTSQCIENDMTGDKNKKGLTKVVDKEL